MAENRTPRDQVVRERTTRAVYTPPSTLPDPTPEPGYAYRWIATHVLGQSTPTNVSQKFREGWVPVKAEDHPELHVHGNPTTGNVEIGGLLLCKNSIEAARARDEYYANLNRAQAESVDNNFMRENDPRMPLFSEKQTRVSFGRGS